MSPGHHRCHARGQERTGRLDRRRARECAILEGVAARRKHGSRDHRPGRRLAGLFQDLTLAWLDCILLVAGHCRCGGNFRLVMQPACA